MILTKCAACAAPLAHDHKKRCSRCKTRYCNEACARGLPPDWTEEELRRQGHDLDATQESSSEEEEDESSSEEEGENPRTGVPSALLADIETSMSHEALLQLPIG